MRLPPFGLDLSEAQQFWEKHSEVYGLAKEPSDPANLHGAFLDGFLHARGWQLDHTQAPQHIYKDEQGLDLRAKLEACEQALKSIQQVEQQPVPMLLWCPECGQRHIDTDEFAYKPHHTHACQDCGMVWRPALVATVGVSFLPGFKNDAT